MLLYLHMGPATVDSLIDRSIDMELKLTTLESFTDARRYFKQSEIVLYRQDPETMAAQAVAQQHQPQITKPQSQQAPLIQQPS
jgi:hypothetical protein